MVIYHPSSFRDHKINWSPRLSDDALASAEWIVPPGLATGARGITGTSAYIWVSGTTAAGSYRLTNIIYTVSGRADATALDLRFGV